MIDGESLAVCLYRGYKVNLNHLCLMRSVHAAAARCAAHLPMAGEIHTSSGVRERREGRTDVLRVKTRQCISQFHGLMEGKVTVVMEERGNPSLQRSFLQQI